MSQGVKTVVYPARDLPRAKALFSAVLGTEPAFESPYYVGWRIDGQDIGLDPNGHRQGMTAYFEVDDIKKTLQSLLDAGATIIEEITEVGPGKQIASVKDADGNIVGLSQSPA